jgi:hypothetical protein
MMMKNWGTVSAQKRPGIHIPEKCTRLKMNNLFLISMVPVFYYNSVAGRVLAPFRLASGSAGGCQGFSEPDLSTLLYNQTPFFKRII